MTAEKTREQQIEEGVNKVGKSLIGGKNFHQISLGNATNRAVIKSPERVTVEIHQQKMGLQKMDRDKSRFFK